MDPLKRPITRSRARLISVFGFAAFLAVWQGAALIPAKWQVISGPVDVIGAFIGMLHTPFAGGTLLDHTLASLWRFGTGFGLAVVLGLPLGLLMGRYRIFDAIMTPAFNMFRYVAPIAWVPFAVLWFGTGAGGPILIIFSGAFAACVVGAYGGAKLIDPPLIEAARTLGASNRKLLWEVVVPSAMPSMISAIRVAAGNAWQSLVGAELIVADSGLAYIMVRGQMNRTVTIVMVGMLTIGLVGLVMEWLLGRLEMLSQRRHGRLAE